MYARAQRWIRELDCTREGELEITTPHGKTEYHDEPSRYSIGRENVIDVTVIPRSYRKGGKTGLGDEREGEKKSGSGKGSVTDQQ
jgi:hypothetical protein